MEVVGRFPDGDECEQYQISRFAPVWLPALAGQMLHPLIANRNVELR